MFACMLAPGIGIFFSGEIEFFSLDKHALQRFVHFKRTTHTAGSTFYVHTHVRTMPINLSVCLAVQLHILSERKTEHSPSLLVQPGFVSSPCIYIYIYRMMPMSVYAHMYLSEGPTPFLALLLNLVTLFLGMRSTYYSTRHTKEG